jgi:hypothetical protein
LLKPELQRIAGPLVADWDSDGRSQFEAVGVCTTAAAKEIQGGLELVERLLLPAADDDLPRLVLVEDLDLNHEVLGRCDARQLAWELEHYHYPADQEGRPLRADLPVKRDDDAADALRYLCVAVVGWIRGGGYVGDDGLGDRIHPAVR